MWESLQSLRVRRWFSLGPPFFLRTYNWLVKTWPQFDRERDENLNSKVYNVGIIALFQVFPNPFAAQLRRPPWTAPCWTSAKTRGRPLHCQRDLEIPYRHQLNFRNILTMLGEVVHEFHLPNIFFGLPKIMLEWHVLFIMDLIIWKPFFCYVFIEWSSQHYLLRLWHYFLCLSIAVDSPPWVRRRSVRRRSRRRWRRCGERRRLRRQRRAARRERTSAAPPRWSWRDRNPTLSRPRPRRPARHHYPKPGKKQTRHSFRHRNGYSL